MTAELSERRIGGLSHVTVTGNRLDAFAQLGSTFADSIAAVQHAMPERSALLQWRTTDSGHRRFSDLVSVTSEQYPDEFAELHAMSDGANVPLDELLLANLRGDLGTTDGTGCSDLAWQGDQPFMAHNEDAAPALDGQLRLLTLQLDDRPAVHTLWYPGFVPSNAFAVNAFGVGWGINHIQVSNPPIAPGRHFVARALQQAENLSDALRFLAAHESAGGFAYTIGSVRDRSVAVVEAAAGQMASHFPTSADPYAWHTNHLKMLPSELDEDSTDDAVNGTAQLGHYDESRTRGDLLSQLQPPRDEPVSDYFLRILTSESLPDGVRRDAADNDPLMTICTVVFDICNAKLLVSGRHCIQPEFLPVPTAEHYPA